MKNCKLDVLWHILWITYLQRFNEIHQIKRLNIYNGWDKTSFHIRIILLIKHVVSSVGNVEIQVKNIKYIYIYVAK